MCGLLQSYNPHSSSNTQMLLSAVLCALCAPSVRLRSTFPLLGMSPSTDNSMQRGLSPSDNTGHPMMSVSDSHNYPILVEQMSYKSQVRVVNYYNHFCFLNFCKLTSNQYLTNFLTQKRDFCNLSLVRFLG